MPYTNFPNGITSFGIPQTGSIPLVLGSTGVGKIYFVDATNGVDGNSGLSTGQALKTIPAAYALAVSGDTIALSTNSSHTLTAVLNLTTNRINFIGLDFDGRQVQQGAKVQIAGTTAAAYVIKNTGIRNSFTNIKFIQGSTDATALTAFQEGGEGTLFANCSFTFGVATNLGSTSASEMVFGSDSATYVNCQFGSDTLLTTVARPVTLIKAVNGTTEFKSNVFQNCNWLVSSSSASALLLKLNSVSDILFTNVFKDCTFTASVDSAGGIALTTAVFTGTGTVKGGLYFVRPASFNSAFCVATSGGNANVQVVAPISSATAIRGIQPTA